MFPVPPATARSRRPSSSKFASSMDVASKDSGNTTGAWNSDDFICRLVRGVVALGAMPDLSASMDLVPVDYAMNEACSAGTGSFLEESAAGDLDIHEAAEIGPIAVGATAPLRFGEHCSAFINSDIRKAIQQGASRGDIVAGLILSIVANYLNRVVGNRRIGSRIVLQGGVAKNPAVPLAFAQLLGKHVVVPPDPELMGAYGVALMALGRLREGRLEPSRVRLGELAARAIHTEKEYRCKACENLCPIRIMSPARSDSR